MVRNAMRRAVALDDLLHLAKFVCRHRGKQVVLDLAGKPARAVINSRMVLDVPARQDLLAQEIYRLGAFQQRHPLMIRSEYQSQIQSQEHLLHNEEQDGISPAKQETKQSQKPARVQDERAHLNHRMRHSIAPQEQNAVMLQHECLEQ